jgi:hypothetical protein
MNLADAITLVSQTSTGVRMQRATAVAGGGDIDGAIVLVDAWMGAPPAVGAPVLLLMQGSTVVGVGLVLVP